VEELFRADSTLAETATAGRPTGLTGAVDGH
jgi:hypothetical protein